MNYVLQLTTGEKFRINKIEAESIIGVKSDGSIAIKRLGIMIPKRMCIIYPEHSADRIEEKKKQQTGILHDGTLVKRHFGQWVLNDLVPDENGNYQPIKIDPTYYPEVYADAVASEDEWKQIKSNNLNYFEYFGINETKERIENKNEFTKLGDIIQPIKKVTDKAK
jgi:hypothetical protein